MHCGNLWKLPVIPLLIVFALSYTFFLFSLGIKIWQTGVAAQFSQLAVKEVPEPITDNQDEKPLFSSPPEVTVEATASVDSGPSSREAWEQGFIDYTGKDSFDNIMQKIKKTLESNKKPWIEQYLMQKFIYCKNAGKAILAANTFIAFTNLYFGSSSQSDLICWA